MSTSARSVLLLGATGLVGGECLRLLADDPAFSRVVVATRRRLPEPPEGGGYPAKVEERITDFERLADEPDIVRVGVVICALGTTLARAGSREHFRRVDLGYPLEVARRACLAGARQFVLISAIGAAARSWFFYNRVKGELEDAVSALPFRGVTLLRPSLLLGERAEHRRGERVAERLSFLFPPRFRAVPAAEVAAAAVLAAREEWPGRRVVESRRIPEFAAAYHQTRRST